MVQTPSDSNFTFDYDLPKRLIAQQPLENRADARLMVVDRRAERLDHYHVRDLPELLQAGDRLVLNNTRVIPAGLQGVRTDTGGRWHGLFLGALEDGRWTILCKTRGHLHAGDDVTLLDRDMRPAIHLRLLERNEGGKWLAQPAAEGPAAELLEQVGRVPLPHYIRGGRMVDADVEDYQTVFARRPGAVAAPTAGLHFTKPLLAAIEQQGVGLTAVTLHVGLGTFRPIQSQSLDQHTMHQEWAEVTEAAAREINATRSGGDRIVAVGTTVVRVLESAVGHAEAASDAETARMLQPWRGYTGLFIRPPFKFGAIDALMTNFHFPRTTLLVLVEAFAGRALLRRAYEEAIREEYRFYSYGDAMLIV